MNARQHIMKTAGHIRLTIRHFGLRSTDRLDSMVENGLLPLRSRLRIEEVSVLLARYHERSPAFHARIAVVTPGPDLLASATGHTIEAAFEQALLELSRRIDARAIKRVRRLRSPKPKPALQRRRSGSLSAR